MGMYGAAIITNQGQNILTQAIANNEPVTFSSVKTSSYSYPAETDIEQLTGLQDIVQSVSPFSAKITSNNTISVSSRFSNENIQQTYSIQTIGLYAQLSGQAEQLFAVIQATTPDQMPAGSEYQMGYIYNISLSIQSDQSVSVTVNPSGTATVQDILDLQENKISVTAIDNNLNGTDPSHVLASPQGAVLNAAITQLNSDLELISNNMYLHGDSAFGYSPGIGAYLNDDNYRPRWAQSGDNVVVYGVFSVGIAPTTDNNILLTGFPKPYTHTWINVSKMGSNEMHEVYLNLDGKITSNNIPTGAYKINFCYRAASLI